jgi:hypothetical protein
MMSLPIDKIKVGERFRKDLGDIDGLAKSIADCGCLLHRVVVDEDHNLIAGRRRLEACRRLGWKMVPVNIVPLRDLVKGEYQEKTERKDFTNSEAVAIMEAVEPPIKEEAKQRQKEHGGTAPGRTKQNTSSNLDTVSKGRSDEAVAKYTGKKKSTLRKGRVIVEAAEKEPEKFKEISDKVDSGEMSVDKGYQVVKKTQAMDEVQRALIG